ncbi:MAG: TlpA disulfide reductase family protein [Pseudomonadota bacterium]|nr:TlpA disulfide reductase family protein [Pseudomonadota bacterium]
MIRMLRDWGAAVAVGLAVFFLVDLLSSSADPTGDMAPAFELANASGGTTKLADYAGKTVVLNFWGSWCGPCVQEIPEFATWAEQHADVPILGIAQGSGSGEKLAKSATRLGVTWPVLESSPAVLSAYGVQVYPTTVIVGPDGAIKQVVRGAIDADGLEKAVASAR